MWRLPLRGARRLAVRACDRWFALCYCQTYAITVPLYLLTFAVAESWFFFIRRRFERARQWQAHLTHQKGADAAEGRRFWESQLEHDGDDVEAIFRGIMVGDSHLPMRRGNVAEYVAWSIYGVREDSLDAEQRATVDSIVSRCEGAMGRPLPPGREAGLRPMLYTLEVFQSCHMPLCYYIALQVGRQLVSAFLRYHGFELLRVGRLDYFCRPAPPSLQRPTPPTPQPIVLLHGVLGLLPYPALLREIARMHEGAVLVPLFHHCSLEIEHLLRISEAPHDSVELCAAIRTMVAKHAPVGENNSPPRAAFMCHSLGSGFLASLLKLAPDLASAACFIDPICFRLADGGALRQFFYTDPPLSAATWRDPKSWFHPLQRKLVANEPTIQDCFRRCFWWSQNWLHPAELPCDSLVVLSGRDSVADSNAVHDHLRSWQQRSGGKLRLEVQLHEKFAHGWLLLHPSVQRSCIQRLQAMMEEAAAACTPPRLSRNHSLPILADAHDLNARSSSSSSSQHSWDAQRSPCGDGAAPPAQGSPARRAKARPGRLAALPRAASDADLHQPYTPQRWQSSLPSSLSPISGSPYTSPVVAPMSLPPPPAFWPADDVPNSPTRTLGDAERMRGAWPTAWDDGGQRKWGAHGAGARPMPRRRVRFSGEAGSRPPCAKDDEYDDDDDETSSASSSTDGTSSRANSSSQPGSELGSPRRSE